jgi:hypothetical protein
MLAMGGASYSQIQRQRHVMPMENDQNAKAAVAALARIFTLVGTLAVMGLVHSFASSIPGTTSVIIGNYTLADWISVILIPVMGLVSIGFLKPSRELAVDFLRRSIRDRKTTDPIEQQVVTAVYALTLLLVIMLCYYFARQSLENPILSGIATLRSMMDVIVSLVGVVTVMVFAVNLIRIVRYVSQALAKDLMGGGE